MQRSLTTALMTLLLAGAAMPSVDASTVTGPGGAEVRDVAGVGAAYCQAETNALPFYCDALPGTPGGSGFGVAGFDTAWSTTDGNHAIQVSVDYNGEFPCIPGACGFQITVCNNRDLDYDPVVCSDQGGEPDQLFTAYSEGFGPATATLTACIRPSVYYDGVGTLYDPSSPGRWNNAYQIAVYIGAWAGAQGAGVSVGTYDVTMTDLGTGCTIAAEDLPARQGSSPLLLLPECFDLQNNDYDTGTDWPSDTGCDSPLDGSEYGGNACDDGEDNDHDGNTDWPNDPGCTSSTDSSEREPGNVCDDGLDNDGDTFADFPSDPGCSSNTDNDERGGTVCDNGLDDDGDGAFDYPADNGCSGPRDNTETDPQARRVYGRA